jgi:hypothetical protein
MFYWTLIIVNIVVLVLGAMERNDPPPPCEEDPHCWSEPRMPRIEFITLETSETPREVLERDFPELAPLPIRGGWGSRLKEIGGYRKDQASPDVSAEVEATLAEHGVYRRESVYHMFWHWGVPAYPVGPIEELGF